MSRFQRSREELAQELEEKEQLLQAKEFQAQVYKEDAEYANAKAVAYEQDYYKERREKELAQSQHESLTKAFMAQYDARDQEGHNDGQFRGPIPEHQEYQKLREEVRHLYQLNDKLNLQLRREMQRSDELLQKLQQQRSCVNELERTKKVLAGVKKENSEHVQEITYLKENNQVLQREKELAESQSEASRQRLFTTVLQNQTGFDDTLLSQGKDDLQRQLTNCRAKIQQLEKDKQEGNEQLRRALSEVEKLKKEKEGAESRYFAYQKDNKLLQNQLDSLKRHNVSSLDAENFQDEIDRLRKDCERSETNNKILRDRIQELSSENTESKEFKKKATNIDAERKQYREERRRWEQEKSAILLEKAKLERELQELQGQHLSTVSKEDPSKPKGRPKRVWWSDASELKSAGNEDGGWSGDSAISGDVKKLQRERRYSSPPTPVYGMSASQSSKPLHQTQSSDEIDLKTTIMEMKAQIQQLSEKIDDGNSSYSQSQSSRPRTYNKEDRSKLDTITYILKGLLN